MEEKKMTFLQKLKLTDPELYREKRRIYSQRYYEKNKNLIKKKELDKYHNPEHHDSILERQKQYKKEWYQRQKATLTV